MTAQTVSGFLDKALTGYRPSSIVFLSCGCCVALHQLYLLLEPGFLWKRFNAFKWKILRVLLSPIVSKKIKEATATFEYPQKADAPVFDELPKKGLEKDKIINLASELHRALDHSYSKGTLSGCVYHGGEAHTELVNTIMDMYQWTNPLHVDVFAAVRQMEAEIVSMVVRMYNGHTSRPDACGCVTSGGTESICMAMKTAREWGKKVKGIQHASIVMPITAHPAFEKAAHFYQMEMIKVPVDSVTGRVNPSEVEKYIKSNTVVIVGSAPNFPHGTVDPIPELAELAYSKGICMHVDACLGGFIVPFMEKAGYRDLPVFDFRNRGVTSISCDTHKYGFAPKGTSVVLYGSKSLRHFHFFACAEWPGGIYCSPGAPGSKPGNVIAGTWAAMLSIGEEGYVDSCRSIVGAAKQMLAGLKKIPQIRILGTPQASVVGFTSDEIDIYVLSDRLKTQGWMLNPLQFPCGVQFSVTLLQTQNGIVEKFLSDVQEGVSFLVAEREALLTKGDKSALKIGTKGATLYGSQQRVADRTILHDMLNIYLDGYHETHHEKH